MTGMAFETAETLEMTSPEDTPARAAYAELVEFVMSAPPLLRRYATMPLETEGRIGGRMSLRDIVETFGSPARRRRL